MARPKAPKYGRQMPSRPSQRTEGGDPITNARTQLYKAAKFLGDVSAAQKGNIGERMIRRAIGKGTSKGIGKFF